jgi:CMP-2-keto-3-deoxyoctulosonic acid synthetase
VDPSKTDAVKTFPVPRNQHDVRRFLGLYNYYRKFVKNYSKITNPLNKLQAKDTKLVW